MASNFPLIPGDSGCVAAGGKFRGVIGRDDNEIVTGTYTVEGGTVTITPDFPDTRTITFQGEATLENICAAVRKSYEEEPFTPKGFSWT